MSARVIHKRWASLVCRSPSFLHVWVILGLIKVTSHELIRCTSNEDCPVGGRCFKDECARCLCPEGFQVINLYNEGRLSKLCQKREDVPLKIGDACGQPSNRQCPYGSYCDPFTSVCVCDDGLRPHEDVSHCRQGLYGERCTDKMGCGGNLGLRCKGKPNMCKCKSSNHRPSKWTRFVLKRWDYSTVEGEPQECVARVVGEPCDNDRECADVQGSGAICRPCGHCECRVSDHVPDVLGTKCGPGLGLGQTCTIDSAFVCDGSRGLQCGDVCDLYAFDFGRKECRCSQMHDNVNNRCVPKRLGSPCYTDLDCYPVQEGYGYCDNGACAAEARTGYTPYLVSHACKSSLDFDSPQHPGDTSNSSRAHRHQSNPGQSGSNKDSLLTIRFDNITDYINIEHTTHSSGHGRGMAKSDPRTSDRSSCLQAHVTWAYAVVMCIVLKLWIT